MRFIHKQDTDSTNNDAHELARSGETGPLWIRADTQTSGKGRRGREWVSKSGNLFTSGLFPAFADVSKTVQLSFIAALAIYETIKTYAPLANVSLKWPNDVLVEGAKISGVLLETGQVKFGPYVVVGIGLNLTHHPDLTLYPATHLLEHVDPSDMNRPEPIYTGPEGVLAVLASRFEIWRGVHAQDGFQTIAKAWMEKAHGMGKRAYIDNSPVTLRGLGPNGELRVEYDNGTVDTVVAADVSYHPPSQ